MADFIKTVRSETAKPNLFALGEFWKYSVDDLSRYVDGLGTQVRNSPSFCELIPNPLLSISPYADLDACEISSSVYLTFPCTINLRRRATVDVILTCEPSGMGLLFKWNQYTLLLLLTTMSTFQFHYTCSGPDLFIRFSVCLALYVGQ